ncbi:helix-turn-helix domain-containing protein [Lactococcus lactis]|uniref:helix-turn-helix domain-containing protein n=1 Tax=Lactococcus lactis TaxID=1358 RepID=UPI00288DFB88|nr:helix-turn-helix domain-containing protein [Lactococcus lactis]MDT2867633.1 helix-turn-helix domain-containing protein [Lactococcus lactis]MDT2874513.1 helix-turn-helix domain-containing protein [Lactococcus lactis]MDT2895329.1 helix-turn-helix domain-containing protein [Lactococcus lactis]MDT2904489.1 helix-turn-helix domain-containing protein [Lactococcus lactis]MDT2919238.1 helix-turn-helix domain-containing protein [Lactococcus lactis]
MAVSKNKGGRPRLDNTTKVKIVEMYQKQAYTAKEIASELDISRSSVYRIIEKNNKG